VEVSLLITESNVVAADVARRISVDVKLSDGDRFAVEKEQK